MGALFSPPLIVTDRHVKSRSVPAVPELISMTPAALRAVPRSAVPFVAVVLEYLYIPFEAIDMLGDATRVPT
jgi:hypothetical protein